MKLFELANTLIDIGILLVSSGANTQRVRNTIKRFAEPFGVDSEVLITHQSLHLYLKDRQSGEFVQLLKRSFSYDNNLTILSSLSELSWQVAHGGWTLDQINRAVEQTRQAPRYSLALVSLAVSLAGGAFCRLFGGGFLEMLVVVVATFGGFVTRNQALRSRFNPYVSIYLAALAASLISLGLGEFLPLLQPKYTLPASLLFLIPGIPLINSFSDFVDGNLLNGLLRSIHSLLIALTITLGYLTAYLIFR